MDSNDMELEVVPQTKITGMEDPSGDNENLAKDQEEGRNEKKKGNKISWRSEKSTFRKCFRTGALILAWICQGSFMEINGPTLKDLILLTGSNYDGVTGAVSGRSVGKFIGAVVGGFLTDRFERYCDCIVASCLAIAALSIVCVPLVGNTDIIWFIYLVLGCCIGCIAIAGQRTVLLLWEEKAASPMHIIHLGYGLGGSIAPLIANPFLAEIRTYGPNVTYNGTTNLTSEMVSTPALPTTTITEVLSQSRIHIAYLIVAIATMVTACMFYIFQCKTSGTRKVKMDEERNIVNRSWKSWKSWRNLFNPASCAGGSFFYGATILGMLFLKYVFYTAADRSLGIFVRSYAIDQLNFSKDDGSYLNTIFWIFFMVGRFAGFISTRWISIKIVMLFESIFTFVTAIGLCTIGTHSPKALWVLTGMAGFGIGPMFPSGIAWGDLHIEMTGLAMTWVLLGSSIGGVTFLKTAGRAYEYFGPTSFVFMLLILMAATLLMDLILTIVSVVLKRYSKSNIQHEKDDNVKEDDEGSSSSPGEREPLRTNQTDSE